MRSYLMVLWRHEHADEPVLLYSELDGERWETRKVEVFRDGRVGLASEDVEIGGSMLGDVAMPPLDEIAEEAEFLPRLIEEAEFETIWQVARRLSATGGSANDE